MCRLRLQQFDHGSSPISADCTWMTSRRINLVEERLTASIIGSFFDVYNYFGFGLLESVYANALAADLRAKGHRVDREIRVPVFYKGEQIGWQRIDQLVDDKVIVETKASVKLLPTDEPQLRTYLNATKLEIGLLLHFGPTPKFYRFIVSNDMRHLR